MERKLRLTESERAQAVAALDLAIGGDTPSRFAQEIRADVAAGEIMLADAVKRIRDTTVSVSVKYDDPSVPAYIYTVQQHKARYTILTEAYMPYVELVNGEWVPTGEHEYEWLPIFEFSTRSELAAYLWTEFSGIETSELLARCREIGVPA